MPKKKKTFKTGDYVCGQGANNNMFYGKITKKNKEGFLLNYYIKGGKTIFKGKILKSFYKKTFLVEGWFDKEIIGWRIKNLK